MIENKRINFSIVIAAKNEEANVIPLLDSLSSLNYPRENFEVIIVDDMSSDDTYSLAKNYNSANFCLKILSSSGKLYNGKKGALDIGITEAVNNYIIVTDADCRPCPDWLRYYQDYFEKGFDFLFGPAPFYQDDNNMINNISCFENLRSSLLYKFFTGIGFPYAAAARNFGFSKYAFQRAGGYSNTTETIGGDDDLLLKEAFKNKLNIGYIDNPGASVFSVTQKDLKAYLKQKKRHTKTSFYYLPIHQVMLAVWHIFNILVLLTPFFPVKLITDYIIVKRNQKKYNYNFGEFYQIFSLQIVYELLLIVNFFYALFGKDEWK